MTDFDSEKYWQEKSASYRETMQSSYNLNRLNMVYALLADSDLTGSVLDFGCGDGVLAERVLNAGGCVSCFDIDPSMVDVTRARLASMPNEKGATYSVLQGGVGALGRLPDKSFDTILAANVIAYLSTSEEQDFYIQSHRLLRAGGALITTHSNELFDLFTFNKYTVRFFERNFATHAPMDGISSLLVHPDKPERNPLPVRENPLSYRHKLARYGFQEERQEFSILHKLPPLLMKDFDPDAIESRECPDTIGWPPSEQWKLMFMCSIFGSRSVKRAV